MPDHATVLYLAAGNPVSPAAGMDVVVREHILELLQLETVVLHGIVVVPGVLGRNLSVAAPWPNFRAFVGDLQTDTTPWRRGAKKMLLILKGRLLANYAYASRAARKQISLGLRAGPDLVVIDHAASFANISMRELRRHAVRMIFIAHDLNHHSLLESGRLKTSRLARAYSKVQAAQAWWMERAAIKLSTRTIFLSEWDREHLGLSEPGKTLVLCPAPAPAPAEAAVPEPLPADARAPAPLPADADRKKVAREPAEALDENGVVFIGSPGFPPNRWALAWIIEQLAPRLAVLDPTIKLILVGKGMEVMAGVQAGNICAPGFMASDRLNQLLRTCICAVSPVVHGSGLKIKVLEYFAAACPVIATRESLRGFEFMQVPATLDLADPEGTARQIIDLACDDEIRELERRRLRKNWNDYGIYRSGRLNAVVGATLSETLQ